MISESKFAEGIEKNVSRVTHYQSGGDGSGDGGCDCIGLIIGAVRLAGGKWPWTHGSNYAARNRMQDFRSVKSEKELKLHELVYKAHQPGETGYDLPAKYKKSGDLNDYYHVGVVTSMKPFRITHCTSVAGGIKVDSTLGQWRYAGWLDQVKRNAEKQEEGEQKHMTQYQVTGGNLMLRKGPGQKNAVLKVMPNGSIVNQIDEEKDGWMYVEYQGTNGYCMAKFLQPTGEGNLDDDSIGAAIETAFANVYQALDELKMLISVL